MGIIQNNFKNLSWFSTDDNYIPNGCNFLRWNFLSKWYCIFLGRFYIYKIWSCQIHSQNSDFEVQKCRNVNIFFFVKQNNNSIKHMSLIFKSTNFSFYIIYMFVIRILFFFIKIKTGTIEHWNGFYHWCHTNIHCRLDNGNRFVTSTYIYIRDCSKYYTILLMRDIVNHGCDLENQK